MIIQLLIDFLYQLIKSSWLASAILVKYVLLGFLGYELIQQKAQEEIKADFDYYNHYFVGLMVLTGFIFYVASLDPKPLVPIIGEVTALIFYGYLFWDY